MNQKPINDSIQALRGILFIGVFLWHLELGVGYGLGNFGVCCFFILSGLLTGLKDSSRNQTSTIRECLGFAIKRVRNLYPLHIATLIVAIPLQLSYGSSFVLPMICQTFLIHSAIPKDDFYYSFNFASWFYSTYFLIMFLLPPISRMVYKIHNKMNAIWVTYAIQCALAFALYKLTDSSFVYYGTYICPVFRFGDVIIGLLVGYCLKDKTIRYRRNSNGIEVCLATGYVIFVCLLQVYRDSIPSYLSTSIIYIPISVALVIVFWLNDGGITKCLSRSFLVLIGNISPYAFLIHQVVIRYVDGFALKWNFLSLPLWKVIFCATFTIVLSVLWKQCALILKKRAFF